MYKPAKMHESQTKVFNVRDLSLNSRNRVGEQGFFISVFHLPGDPPKANRVRVSSQNAEVELLPSKGLSVYQAWINGKPLFWTAPIELPDTESIDLWSEEVCINGTPAPGFTFLKTFSAGVELYGLRNWGMPLMVDGKLQPLHGETSNIPVSEVLFIIEDDKCLLQASFDYLTFEGDLSIPWYQRGEALFRVTRKLILKKDAPEIRLEDTIENISSRSMVPDWGYHITFLPEDGAKYLVPSQHKEDRWGNPLPSDIETWHKAADEKVRTETGVIHKNLCVSGSGVVSSWLVYTDNTGIEVSTTPSPYFQTWFCNGGMGSSEFTLKSGESILRKNWDGMGIEIGSSALDHNGNIDESVEYLPELRPYEKKTITIGFKWLDNIPLIKKSLNQRR
jgi:hypothetical protein